MKMHQKGLWLLFVCALLTINTLRGQDTIPEDPILRFKSFEEFGITLNTMRVNTNHTTFMTSNGRYDFIKNNILVSLDANINFGILIKSKRSKNSIYLKSGIHLLSRLADLNDNNGSEVRLSTGYIQVPVQFGSRFPLNYNTIKNNLYRAIEVYVGVYAATPFMQKLDHRDNLNARFEFLGANYIKFGIISDLVFTALNTNGYGHKLGIRATSDFTGLVKFNETDNELYPYYSNIGLFYNIRNKYK